MALDDDVFRALGVPRDADEATVKRAYRALALRNHPDRNPGDAAARTRFDRVNRAYAEWNAARDGGSTPATAKTAEEIFETFGDLFSDFFGKPTSGPKRGSDLRIPLRIPYADARDGCTRQISIAREICCTRCRGTGGDRGVMLACASCRGTGHQQTAQGVYLIQETCRVCSGRGRFAESPCDSCEHGLSVVNEAIRVTIPPGLETGQYVQIAGKGNEVYGGEPGQLYVEVTIDTLGVLVRRGDDVVLETPVGARHILFGGTLEVITLDGPMKVTVPRGVRDGDTATLSGRGHVRASAAAPPGGDPYRDLARGDQLVIFRVPLDAARAKTRYVLGWVLAAGAAALGAAIAL